MALKHLRHGAMVIRSTPQCGGQDGWNDDARGRVWWAAHGWADDETGWAVTELIWDGKYDANGKRTAPVRIALPFQTVETVNESAHQR